MSNMNKYFVSLLALFSVFCGLNAQVPIYESNRVYDTVTDSDPWYYFSTPKPCIEPTSYTTAPGQMLVQEYVTPNILTIYGVALTMKDRLNRPINQDDTTIQAILLTMVGPTTNVTLGRLYTMNLMDSVTLNRAHPRFCWFLYEDECVGKESAVQPCYELYFDTPMRIDWVTDTFYVGLERFSNAFLPCYYGGTYSNALPAHLWWGIGREDPIYSYTGSYRGFSLLNYDKLWGVAFPIIGFRCGPIKQYWLYSNVVGSRTLSWPNTEEGTVYNVRIVGEDGSDTTIFTTDTTLVLPPLSDSVRYNIRLRRQCHYATSNYDTTVYSDWLSYISFGTTILPPRDTVWRTVTGLSNNPAWGEVTGGGLYADSSVASLTATPYDDATFEEWSDGNTYNPRLVYVVSDTTLTAVFSSSDDTVGIRHTHLDGFAVQPNPASGTVMVQLPPSVAGCRLSLCDMAGRELEVRPAAATVVWDVSQLPPGTYMIKIATPQGVAAKRLTIAR